MQNVPMRIRSLLICLLTFTASLSMLHGHGKWWKQELYLPPSSLLLHALRWCEGEGVALDLGCGVGNDTVFLVNQGWRVWAIDSHSKSLQLLNSRGDIEAPYRLTTLKCSLESLHWKKLPPAQLIVADHALAFCRPDRFMRIWRNLCNQLVVGGRFVGQFYGVNFRGLNGSSVVFLNCDQVISLFDDFEIEFFDEVEKDEWWTNSSFVHCHVFKVIARKKCRSFEFP